MSTWSLVNTSSWLTASAVGGNLTSGGPATNVTMSLNSTASNLVVGTYPATVVFSNATSHAVQYRPFTLTVLPPELVQNGGFETGNFTGWTLNGIGGTYNFVTNSSWYFAPNSGTYLALLGQTGLPLGTLSQTLATSAGQLYLLSLWYNSPDGLTPNEFSVSWNGTKIFDQSNIGAIGWTHLQYLLTATGPATVLQFGFRDDQTWLGLDDVSVTPALVPSFTSAVRTPGALNLTWGSISGFTYQVQYRTDVVQGAWSNLGASFIATNGTVTTVDAIGPDPQRFYRVILMP